MSASDPDDVTLAVLGSKVDDLRSSVDALAVVVSPLVVGAATTSARVDDAHRRLTLIESTLRWAGRTVGALVIAALVGLVLVDPFSA